MADFKITLETPSGTYVRSFSGWKPCEGDDEYYLLQKRALELWRDHLFALHGDDWKKFDPLRKSYEDHGKD